MGVGVVDRGQRHTISSLTNGTTYTVRVRATRTGANAVPVVPGHRQAMDVRRRPVVHATVSLTRLSSEGQSAADTVVLRQPAGGERWNDGGRALGARTGSLGTRPCTWSRQ